MCQKTKVFVLVKNRKPVPLIIFMGEKYVQEFGPRFLDMSSAGVYMGAKYFQEFGPDFLTCPQLVGTWVQFFFRNLVPDSR